MNLFDLHIGRVVQEKVDTHYIDVRQEDMMYGHVTGFGKNPTGEICPMVKWADETEYLIHPNNLYYE